MAEIEQIFVGTSVDKLDMKIMMVRLIFTVNKKLVPLVCQECHQGGHEVRVHRSTGKWHHLMTNGAVTTEHCKETQEV